MVPDTMEPMAWLRKHLDEADPDLLRAMVKTFADALMGAEADALCNAAYGERSPERINTRNGYRPRDFDTRAGTVELAVPKLRQGSYFPDWLLEPRRRAERALVAVVTQCYRPLDGGPYAFCWLDAMTQKVREGGRIVNIATVIAVGVSVEGHREVLGLDVFTAEDGAGWTAFLRGLVARGLAGVQLVISDAHPGLVDAIASTLPGSSWQRCRTHFMRNLLAKVPRSAQAMVAALVRSIFEQPDAEQVWAQHARIVEQLAERFADATALLIDAAPDVLAFTAFPKECWRQIRSNNPQERLNKELRRRTDVVGIFPDRAAVIRLVGAVLLEQHDEWAVVRRYMSVEALAKARMRVIDGDREEAVAELAEVS